MDRAQEGQEVDERVTDPSLAQRAADIACTACIGEGSGQPLREVLALLQWTFPAGHVTPQGQADYIDGSCLVYAEERLLDIVDFRGAHSAVPASDGHKVSSATLEWSAGRGKAASVLHSGDVMSAEGGTHVIRVQMQGLPESATECFFVISAYNCRNLSLFQSLSMRLFDAAECPPRLLMQFDLPEARGASAVIVCALAQRLGVWSAKGLGRPCGATVRDYAPMEAAIAPMQARHGHWRRRGPWLLLAALVGAGRALPEEGAHVNALLQLMLRLPAILFQMIIYYV